MARIALAFSIMPDAPLPTIVQWAKEAEDAGFDGVYMTESTNDSLACSLAIGLNTKRIGLGTAITNIYLRHPYLLASEVATLHELTGGRFTLGLGTGHRANNARIGIDMGDTKGPLNRMRETATTLRRLLDNGETAPKASGKVRFCMAGLSRPMVQLAGELADGVIFNYFPPARVKEAMGELAEGARKARRDPSAVKPVAFQTAFISDDIEMARRPARTLLSRYGAMPFYGNMMARAGFEREIGQIRAVGTDASAAMAAVSDRMIDATLLAGPEGRMRERIAEVGELGVETVIVFVNPVGEDRASAVRRVIRALKP